MLCLEFWACDRHSFDGYIISLHCASEKLGECVSLLSRVEITEAHLLQLQRSCTEYFNVNALFLQEVNPTVWTIGYMVPFHTKHV